MDGQICIAELPQCQKLECGFVNPRARNAFLYSLLQPLLVYALCTFKPIASPNGVEYCPSSVDSSNK